eukprot:2796433-Prymnesium_polylepis.1
MVQRESDPHPARIPIDTRRADLDVRLAALRRIARGARQRHQHSGMRAVVDAQPQSKRRAIAS